MFELLAAERHRLMVLVNMVPVCLGGQTADFMFNANILSGYKSYIVLLLILKNRCVDLNSCAIDVLDHYM